MDKKIFIFISLVIFMSGCVSLNVEEKIYTSGKMDSIMTVESEYPSVISTLKESLQDSFANLTNEEKGEITFENIDNGFKIYRKNYISENTTIVDEGNFFIHKYVITQTPLMEDYVDESTGSSYSDLFTGNILIEVPGKITDYGSCLKYEDGRVICGLFDEIHIESSCWLWFC